MQGIELKLLAARMRFDDGHGHVDKSKIRSCSGLAVKAKKELRLRTNMYPSACSWTLVGLKTSTLALLSTLPANHPSLASKTDRQRNDQMISVFFGQMSLRIQ